ncbi:hypothetical protein CDD81_7582 [Ophiocordyceps australis]|uniref:Wax synthase domain-containing protein n=1 Tax=Ophiocordyceps australis TaxID=1399860 RepID=A0A2C5X8Z2_9HYPO|nr:hypothetical protein CDD81_7582 [Ophiocordyceps australis]
MELANILLILVCPAMLFGGLLFPRLAFSHKLARVVFALVAVSATALVVLTVRTTNVKLALGLGFFGPCMAVRSIMMFLVHEPWKDFAALRLSRTDSYHNLEIEWQTFPSNSLTARFSWVLNLVLDTRALGWCYSASKGRPCHFHSRLMSQRFAADKQWCAIANIHKTILGALFRILLAIITVDCCLVYLVPALQRHYQEQPLDPLDNRQGDWLFTLPNFSSTLSLSFIFIDAFYCMSRLISAVLFLSGDTNSLIGVMQPSPWGSLTSLYYRGLGGLWGDLWHDYFRLEFSSVAAWATKPLVGSVHPNIVRVAHLFTVFFLSGIAHTCASYMLPSSYHPVRRTLLFFLLQPIAIVAQKLIAPTLKVLIGSMTVYRIVQLIMTLMWACLMLDLVFDDLLLGGVWEARFIRVLPL